MKYLGVSGCSATRAQPKMSISDAELAKLEALAAEVTDSEEENSSSSSEDEEELGGEEANITGQGSCISFYERCVVLM